MLFDTRKWMAVVSMQKKNFINHNFIITDRIIIPFFMKLEFLESSVFSDSETLLKYKNW